MNNDNFLKILLAIIVLVIAISCGIYIGSRGKIDTTSKKQVELLQSDIKKYQSQIEELKKQVEIKQIQIEKAVKEEVKKMTPDEISKGIIEELGR